jgi:hypothetical protein
MRVMGRDLYSDQPDFEAHWLAMLSDAAGWAVSDFNLTNVAQLFDDASAVQKFDARSVHRAEADARRLAAAVAKALFR